MTGAIEQPEGAEVLEAAGAGVDVAQQHGQPGVLRHAHDDDRVPVAAVPDQRQRRRKA